ncbi:hypothetical protein ACLB1G_09630 [Oxalobacteraceae bacterium A2-2]
MIPVLPQPEPLDFDKKVRRPGQKWLFKKIYPHQPLNLPAPSRTRFPSHWTKVLSEFHDAYGGICAYLGTYINLGGGAASMDHFAPKSRAAGLAYEWDNFRLACLLMNSRKNNFSGILDPFSMPPEVFHLVLATGKIQTNPIYAKTVVGAEAEETISRLKLDSKVNRDERATLFVEYKNGHRSAWLMQKYHPFVWSEIVRQGRQ